MLGGEGGPQVRGGEGAPRLRRRDISGTWEAVRSAKILPDMSKSVSHCMTQSLSVVSPLRWQPFSASTFALCMRRKLVPRIWIPRQEVRASALMCVLVLCVCRNFYVYTCRHCRRDRNVRGKRAERGGLGWPCDHSAFSSCCLWGSPKAARILHVRTLTCTHTHPVSSPLVHPLDT